MFVCKYLRLRGKELRDSKVFPFFLISFGSCVSCSLFMWLANLIFWIQSAWLSLFLFRSIVGELQEVSYSLRFRLFLCLDEAFGSFLTWVLFYDTFSRMPSLTLTLDAVLQVCYDFDWRWKEAMYYVVLEPYDWIIRVEMGILIGKCQSLGLKL